MPLDFQNYEQTRLLHKARVANGSRVFRLPDTKVNGCNERRPLRDSDRHTAKDSTDWAILLAAIAVALYWGYVLCCNG